MMNIEQMLRNIPDLSDKPAVCLETTVLTHGMPYPDNVKCALACEEAVREEGAIPYTIGILNTLLARLILSKSIESPATYILIMVVSILFEIFAYFLMPKRLEEVDEYKEMHELAQKNVN